MKVELEVCCNGWRGKHAYLLRFSDPGVSAFLFESTTWTSITGWIDTCVVFVPQNFSLCSMYIFRGGTGDKHFNKLKLADIS